MWEDAIGNEFRQRQGGEYVVVIPDEEGYFEIEIIMPYRLLPPSADQPTYIWVCLRNPNDAGWVASSE